MQRSPADNLLTQRSPAGLTCHHSVPLRGLLLTQTPSCEAPSYIARLVAAIAVAIETLKPVSKRDTMTHRGVRSEVLIFLGLGIRLLL